MDLKAISIKKGLLHMQDMPHLYRKITSFTVRSLKRASILFWESVMAYWVQSWEIRHRSRR